MEREACVCDHGYERSDLCAEIIIINLDLVVSHIQRIGCQPEKTTLHGGQSRSWSAEQGNEW